MFEQNTKKNELHRFGAKIFAAKAALFFERLWPALLPIAAPFYGFVILSLMNLWEHTGPWGYWGGALIAAGATFFCVTRFWRGVSWPSKTEAMARLERDGGVNHSPLQALDDQAFDQQETTNPLWRAHLEQMQHRASETRLTKPHAPIDQRDPWALRYAAIGILAVALTAAGPEAPKRLASAFQPEPLIPATPPQIDVWIDPPVYTGKPPIHLLRSGEDVKGVRDGVTAPEGAVIIAQTTETKNTQLSFHLKHEKISAKSDGNLVKGASNRSTIKLYESGAARLRIKGKEAVWPITILNDRPPQVALMGVPQADERARLGVTFQYTDDYAIAAAEFHMRLDQDQKRPKDAPPFDEKALAKTVTIPIEGTFNSTGQHEALLDLQSHPWAGLVVLAKIIVRDGANAQAASETVRIRLPERTFYAPLAKAVIEQRKNLATGQDPWRRIGRSFDALTLAPEAFYDQPTDYILMRAAYRRVNRRDEGQRDETVNEFWPLALYLEDQDLALARRKLDAAADALREAIAKGAEEEEINRLVQALRQAMNDYMEAFAKSDTPPDTTAPDGKQVAAQDLEKMLGEIENLSRAGAQNAAQSALSDLESLLNNLQKRPPNQANGSQSANRGQAAENGSGEGQQSDPQQGEANAAAAGDLIGRQRSLADRTHREGLTRNNLNTRLDNDLSKPSDQDAAARREALTSEQQKLAQDLDTLGAMLAETSRQSSGTPGQSLENKEQALSAFAEAAREMQRAEHALESNYLDAAGAAMARAIAALRKGAQALADGDQSQTQQAQGQPGGGEAGNARLDPLGRPLGRTGAGKNTNVPEEIDAARARDIINQLRNRLSDGERSQEEIEYLERLLERF